MPVERLTPERRRQLTRAALVEAAAETFALRGFHAASLDEIAEAAGFTRGAIYSNFEDKEDLLLAVLEQYSERQLQIFSGVLERGESWTSPERMEAAAALWSETVHHDRTIMLLSLELRLYALRNEGFRLRLVDLHRRQEERIASLIRDEAAREGVRLLVDPEDFALITWAASDGLQQMASLDAEAGERYDRLARVFFEICARGALEG